MVGKILKTGKLKAWSIYKDKLRKEHKLTYLFWECTMNCNFHCKHCGSKAGEKKYENGLSTEEIKNAFEDIARNFNPREITIAVTGGEPLLRLDIFEVMAYAKSLGFSWGMVTNGYLINENVVQQMKDAGMSSVVVSIDGIGKTHDAFRGVEGSYEKAVQAVRLLSSAEFLKDLQITTSVHSENIGQLEEMYKTFIDFNITSWRAMNVDPIGRAEENKRILLNAEQLKYLLSFIKAKRKKSPINVTYGCESFLGLEYEGDVRGWYFICNTGINTGSILYNGDIFVCPNVSRREEFIQGNVKEDSFSEVWRNKFGLFREKERTKCDKCIKCMFWEECLGGSFHLWDFNNNTPKICQLEMIEK